MQPRTREANPAQLVDRLDALIDQDDRQLMILEDGVLARGESLPCPWKAKYGGVEVSERKPPVVGFPPPTAAGGPMTRFVDNGGDRHLKR